MLMPKTYNNSAESQNNQTAVETLTVGHRKNSLPMKTLSDTQLVKKEKKGLTDAQRREAKFRYTAKITKLNEDNKKEKRVDYKMI